LDTMVKEWDKAGRPSEDYLWPPTRIVLLLEYHGRLGQEMTQPQLDFFQASIAAIEQREKERKHQQQRWNLFLSGGLALTTGLLGVAAYYWQVGQRQRVQQLALVAESLSGTTSVEAQIYAIAAINLAQSPFVSFPFYSIPPESRKQLLKTIQLTQEQYRLRNYIFDNDVYSVTFNKAGSQIISGTGANCLLKWDLSPRKVQPLDHSMKPQGIDEIESYCGTLKNETLKNVSIRSVFLNQEGNLLVSGSSDDEIKILNVENGSSPILPWKGNQKGIWAVAFSPDGNKIVSGGNNNTVKIWDAKTGKPDRNSPKEQHGDIVKAVAFSPDSNKIISGSNDNTVKIWDAKTGELDRNWQKKGHSNAVRAVAFNPNPKNRTIITGGLDKLVKIWNADTGEVIRELEHDGGVNSVAFSPDGTMIVSGSNDRTVRVWDANTGKPIGKPLTGHTDAVNSVAFSTDGKKIVSGGGRTDRTIRIWDIHKPFSGHRDVVFSATFAPSFMGLKETIVSGGRDKKIHLWNPDTGQPLLEPFGKNDDAIYSIVASQKNHLIVRGSFDRTVRIWDLTAKTDKLLESCASGGIQSVAISSDGTKIVGGSDDKTVKLWDTLTGKCGILHVHKNEVKSVAFSQDGQRIASSGLDGLIQISTWNQDSQSFTQSKSFFHQNKKKEKVGVKSIAFSSNGQSIVLGDLNAEIWLLDTRGDSNNFHKIGDHDYEVNAVAFNRDSTRIVSGGKGGLGGLKPDIKLWGPAQQGDNKMIGEPLTGHDMTVRTVAFSNDGKKIVSGSDDGTLRVWDADWSTSWDGVLTLACRNLQNHFLFDARKSTNEQENTSPKISDAISPDFREIADSVNQACEKVLPKLTK
jgi:WD40 repeat protein